MCRFQRHDCLGGRLRRMTYSNCDRCGELALIGGHQKVDFDGDEHPLCATCYDDLREWFRRADDAVYGRELVS